MGGPERAVVFVVDDDPDMQDAASLLLESEGYAVRTFGSADAFLEGLHEQIPDAALIDLKLPGLSGADLALLLGAHDRTRSVCRLALTGRQLGASEAQLFHALLTKPVTGAGLIDFVATALASWRERRASHPDRRARRVSRRRRARR